MRAPAIGIRLAALILAWLAGVAVQLQERWLQSPSFYFGVAAAGMARSSSASPGVGAVSPRPSWQAQARCSPASP